MNLQELLKLQSSFDERHGFKTEKGCDRQLFDCLSKELVGLVGEIGEVANLCKKVNLALDHQLVPDVAKIQERKCAMREELIDALVYLMRLCTLLDVDIEGEYLKKLKSNEGKYREFQV